MFWPFQLPVPVSSIRFWCQCASDYGGCLGVPAVEVEQLCLLLNLIHPQKNFIDSDALSSGEGGKGLNLISLILFPSFWRAVKSEGQK